jgi:hypothetical protein
LRPEDAVIEKSVRVNSQAIRSPVARIIFPILSLCWAGAAWFVLIEGGFHQTHKYSRETTFVGGPGGILMAYLFLLLATVAAWIVLQGLGVRRSAYAIPALLYLALPLLLLIQT